MSRTKSLNGVSTSSFKLVLGKRTPANVRPKVQCLLKRNNSQKLRETNRNFLEFPSSGKTWFHGDRDELLGVRLDLHLEEVLVLPTVEKLFYEFRFLREDYHWNFKRRSRLIQLRYFQGLSKNSSCMVEYTNVNDKIVYTLPLRSCNTMSTDVVSSPRRVRQD